VNNKKIILWLTLTTLAGMSAMARAADVRLDRAALLKLADGYLGALAAHDSRKVALAGGHLAPFAADCERHENGMRTAPYGGPSLGGPTPGSGAPRQPGFRQLSQIGNNQPTLS
jgi:hypothetical protein